jgi:hypothetical protein
MLSSSFLLVARPDTRCTLDSLASSLGRPRRPVVLHGAREPHGCPFQRILFASVTGVVTGAMSATRDCPRGVWSVLRGPQSLRASVVTLVWREAPLCISLLTLAFQAGECATRTSGYNLRECRRTRQQATAPRSAAKWEGTTHGGEREVEVRQNGGVSIRSCFCVSPES